jgi:LysM repeat protein
MKRRGGGYLGKLGLIVLCLVVLLATAEAQTPAPGAGMPSPAATPATTGPAESEGTYVVKKGDTLWGIAKSLLNDPVLWPQIRERNPFITDPNRIFPGDTLAIPGREPAPQAQVPVAEAPKPEPPKEAPKELKEEVKAPAPAPPPAPAAPQTILTPPPPVPPASQMAIACSPILLDEASVEAAGIGSIIRSADNRLMLSMEDSVYVGLDRDQVPKVGDRLAVIRPGARVFHPWQKNTLGRALNTLGVLEVTEVRDKTVRARIAYSCEAMRIGDRVGPLVLTPYPEDKIPQPASRQVEGFIVDSPRSLQHLSLQSAVYLDVGKDKGISPGDVFAIYRPSVPAASLGTGQLFPIPAERLGEATVIRVTDTNSTAVITASGKEIRAGDRAVLSRQIQP